jgi:putative hemolysin
LNTIVCQVLLAVLFFGCSVFFAAAETALVSLSRPRLKKMISQRSVLASALSEWLASPQYLLTTILIGNTLSNVFTTLLVTNLAVEALPWPHRGAVEFLSWLGMSLILFVLGDFVPKSLARYYPQRITLASIRWVSALSRWLTPFIRAGLRLFELLFPALEGAPVGRWPLYSLEEIREMIRASAVQGALPPRATQMMEKALVLPRVPVSQIMTPFPKIESVNLGLGSEAVLDAVAAAGRTRVPVYRAHPRKIGGYLHIKDLLLVWRGALPLRLDSLVRQPLWTGPDTTAGDLLEDFRKGVSHLAVVNNVQGECEGVVSLEDVLEEVVGEILDEYDLSRDAS